MARKRKRAEGSSERPQSSLPPPFPSSPNRPATHVIVAKKEDRYCCLLFSARYSARAFVDFVTEDEGHYKFVRSNGLMQAHFDSGLIIQVEPTKDLEDLIEGPELEGDEAEWILDDLHKGQALITKQGRQHDYIERERKPRSRVKRTASDDTSRPVRVPRQAKTGKSPSDMAKDLGVEAGKVRQALRSLMSKPDKGWDFTDDEYADLLPKVKKALK